MSAATSAARFELGAVLDGRLVKVSVAFTVAWMVGALLLPAGKRICKLELSCTVQ